MDKQDNINVLQRKLDEAEDDNTDIMHELVKHETKKIERHVKHKSDNDLRDWFAGMVMQGYFAASYQEDFTAEDLAIESYEYAEAMMAARKK